MEVGGLEDEAGVWIMLEGGEEGEEEEELGEVVYLEVRVWGRVLLVECSDLYLGLGRDLPRPSMVSL